MMAYLNLQEIIKAKLNRGSQELIRRAITLIALLGLILSFVPAYTAYGSDNSQAGQILYAVTTANRLIKFDSANSCNIISRKQVTGLNKNEKLLAIDFRPLNGQLYGLGSDSRLYTINPDTAVATLVGTGAFTTPLAGKAFGFDFNPTVDRIRIVSSAGQNLRVHPDTAAIAGIDVTLAYSTTDKFAGRQPGVVGAAYTNPDNDPATGTTLYDIDSKLDLLAIQNPPNNGTLNTVGQLGFNTTRLVGFDISTSGIAYATLMQSQGDEEREADEWENGKRQAEEQKNQGGGKRCGNSLLVTVDLASGKVSRVGYIGVPSPVRGLAVPLQ
jgi:hypothetical protein